MLSFTLFAFLPLPANGYDEKSARKTFKKCAACHEIGPEAGNKVGPQLNGIEGRKAASFEEFKYSKAMKAAGDKGLVWSTDTLTEYLANPRKFIKGTRMSFRGVKDPAKLSELVEWLVHFDSAGGETHAPNQGAELLGASAAILAGDPEYGEYIAGECVTCHRLSGETDGIPSIIGWPKEDFVHALYEYKSGVRLNPVMKTVTSRLGDEEMAALAAYFGMLQSQ